MPDAEDIGVPAAPPVPVAPLPPPTPRANPGILSTREKSWMKSQSTANDRRHVLDVIRRVVEFDIPKMHPSLFPEYISNDGPFSFWTCKLSLVQTCAVVQDGPSCGFAALLVSAQVLDARSDLGSRVLLDQGPYDLIKWAQRQGFTHSGELYSAKNVACILSEHFVCRPEVVPFPDKNEDILGQLEAGRILLVPYDHGANHEPINRNGRSAHWCTILGYVQLSNKAFSQTYVLTRHGSSRQVGLWSLDDVRASNAHLHEFDPTRREMAADWRVADFDDLWGLRGLCVTLPTKASMDTECRWTASGDLRTVMSSNHLLAGDMSYMLQRFNMPS